MPQGQLDGVLAADSSNPKSLASICAASLKQLQEASGHLSPVKLYTVQNTEHRTRKAERRMQNAEHRTQNTEHRPLPCWLIFCVSPLCSIAVHTAACTGVCWQHVCSNPGAASICLQSCCWWSSTQGTRALELVSPAVVTATHTYAGSAFQCSLNRLLGHTLQLSFRSTSLTQTCKVNSSAPAHAATNSASLAHAFLTRQDLPGLSVACGLTWADPYSKQQLAETKLHVCNRVLSWKLHDVDCWNTLTFFMFC